MSYDDGEQEESPEVAAARAERLAAHQREIQREKLIERSVLVGAAVFVVLIGALVWTSDRAMAGVYKAVTYLGGGAASKYINQELACRDPKNRNTPYCQERKARIESTWKGIERSTDTPNMFTLHERG